MFSHRDLKFFLCPQKFVPNSARSRHHLAEKVIMASTRKSRSVNMRFAKADDKLPDKNETNANKNRSRKKKLSDMLGPRWSKEELEHFYEAYRKYGKYWKKVAGMTQNRSLEVVEALYNMNKKIELRHMNEEVSRTKKDSAPVTYSENFREQYLMVVAQHKEVCKQVESAMLCLRQHNTYPENSTPPWHTPRSSGPATHQGSFSPALHSQDSASSIIEIVQSSRQKARSMVDIAVQATDDLRGEEAFVRIGEALDLKNTNSKLRYIPPDLAHEKSGYEYCTCRIEVTSSHIHSPKCNNANDGNRVQFPIEMISNCVATLFMIQNCAERQYPPAEVAQVLDATVTSLQPCCPKNLQVYREMEACMAIIKNQMLALIATSSIFYSFEASIV